MGRAPSKELCPATCRFAYNLLPRGHSRYGQTRPRAERRIWVVLGLGGLFIKSVALPIASGYSVEVADGRLFRIASAAGYSIGGRPGRRCALQSRRSALGDVDLRAQWSVSGRPVPKPGGPLHPSRLLGPPAKPCSWLDKAPVCAAGASSANANPPLGGPARDGRSARREVPGDGGPWAFEGAGVFG